MRSKPYFFSHSALKQVVFEKDPQAWYACGICSLYTSMRLLGISNRSPYDIHDQFENLKSLKCIRKCGPTLFDLERVAKMNGLNYRYREFSRNEGSLWSWMQRVSAKALPILIFPPEHCIVAWGVTNNGCWIMDPDTKDDFQFYSKTKVFEYWKRGNSEPFLRCAIISLKTP